MMMYKFIKELLIIINSLMDNSNTNEQQSNPQQCYYNENQDYEQSHEQEMDVEEQMEEYVPTQICDSCGYQNDIYSSSCLVCEKSFLEYEEEIQNQVPCYICGLLSAISVYEDHTMKCEFERKIFCLRKGKVFDTNLSLNKPDGKMKIKKSDTKGCMYCGSSYLLDFIHEHQKTCTKRPQPMKNQQVRAEIEKIQFQINEYLTQTQFERLTSVQDKALTYMHKKAVHYHKQSKDAFEKKAKGIGFSSDDILKLYDYIQHRAPLAIHVNLQKYVEYFINDTNYRNLFQTNTGSGCTNKLTRKNVEDKIFNNIFFDAQHFERVKYGAMNFTNDPKGIQCAKGYGKSYFLLKNHVRPRCTVTYCDSFGCGQADFGTFMNCSHVLNRFSDAELKAALKAAGGSEQSSSVTGSYKQIQIHGAVQFSLDVQTLCIDSQELTSEESLNNILAFIKLYGVDYRVF